MALDTLDVAQTAALFEQLELQSVVPAVRENGIDGGMLAVLSDEELQEHLGMKPLQIKKLRVRLAAMEGGGSDVAAVADAPPPAAPVYAANPFAAAAPAAAAAPVAAMGGVPVAAAPPATMMAAAPGPDVNAIVHAQNMLHHADNDLASASQLLGSAMTTSAVQTGGALLTRGPRRAGGTLVNAAVDSRQKAATEQAVGLAARAAQGIASARAAVPSMPPIDATKVQAMSGVLMQGITNFGAADALRTAKVKSSKSSVDKARTQIAAAQAYLAALRDSAAPGGGYAAAPPPQQQQQQQPMYTAAPAAAAPPPGRTGPSPATAALAGALLGSRIGRRRR